MRGVVAHRSPVDPCAGDGEGRVEHEAGLDRGTRLFEPAKPGKGRGQVEMRLGIIPVGFDRPAAPQDGLLAIPQVVFRDANFGQPRIGRHIARAQAKRLVDVSLGFLGATGKDLAKADEGMSVGKIAVQRQRMLAFGDPLDGPLRQNLDVAEKRMAACVVRERRQCSGQLRFGGCESRRWDRRRRSFRPRRCQPPPTQRARRHCRDRR